LLNLAGLVLNLAVTEGGYHAFPIDVWCKIPFLLMFNRIVRSNFLPGSAVSIKDMKTTQYFDFTRKRPAKALIKDEWISFVIVNPEKTHLQTDGRVRCWARIADVDKYLRVILLEDGETVHNAFFDRSFRRE
jgi:hypothetical protein